MENKQEVKNEQAVLNKLNLEPTKVIYQVKLSTAINTALNNIKRYVQGTRGIQMKVTSKSVTVSLLINPENNSCMTYNSHSDIIPMKNKYSIDKVALSKTLETAGVIRPYSNLYTEEIKDSGVAKGVSVIIDIDVETAILSVLKFNENRVYVLETIEPISERDAVLTISEYDKNRTYQRNNNYDDRRSKGKRKQRQSVDELFNQIGV